MAREGGRSGQKTALRSRKSIAAGTFPRQPRKAGFPQPRRGAAPPPAGPNAGEMGAAVHGTFAGSPGRTHRPAPSSSTQAGLRSPGSEAGASPFLPRRLLLLRDVEVGDGAVVDLGRHAHRFAQGRMRVDGVADVLDLAAHLNGEADLADQVAGMHADDAAAD